MWDVYMDCSHTNDGYFEVKGYLNGQWERDISQNRCNGLYSGKSFYSGSNNHIARYANKLQNTNTKYLHIKRCIWKKLLFTCI